MSVDILPHAPNTMPIPENILNTIETKWIERVRTQRFPTSGKRYQNDEREFFVGAMTAILAMNPEYFVPPRWAIRLMCGRPIMEAERFK